MKAVAILGICLLALSSLACGKGDTPKAQDKTYDITGAVVSIDQASKKVTLDHEDIPGLMKGMKMPFDVENAQILEGLKAGDKVHGKLKAQGGRYTILELHKR